MRLIRSFLLLALLGSPLIAVAAEQHPAGTALSSCQAIEHSGHYYLAQDVTCAEQGFALNASGIVLNLNGHTITYGSVDAVVPAISICDRWYTRLPSTSCGDGAHANPEVFGGAIVQAAGSRGFTHTIWIGQANGLRGGSIHDLTITIQEPGTQAIWGEYPGSGWHIYKNTINDRVTNIQQPHQVPLSARSHFQGVVIYFNNDNKYGAGNEFDHNIIHGSPQGGILDATQNSRITENEIHLTSLYSNDYGITVLADRQRVSGNTIIGRGRGIDVEASRFQISGNQISDYEDATNSEYGGCELGGGYGIRIKNYPGSPPSTQGTIDDNTVTVSAEHCPAVGLQFSDLVAATQVKIQGNTFRMLPGRGKTDAALGYSGANHPALEFEKNIWSATHAVVCEWDGCAGVIQAGQTWNLLGTTVLAHDGNAFPGSQSEMGAYPDELIIEDTIAHPAVECGPQSTLTARIRAYVHRCISKPN